MGEVKETVKTLGGDVKDTLIGKLQPSSSQPGYTHQVDEMTTKTSERDVCYDSIN